MKLTGKIEIEMVNDFNTRAYWEYVANGCIYALLYCYVLCFV